MRANVKYNTKLASSVTDCSTTQEPDDADTASGWSIIRMPYWLEILDFLSELFGPLGIFFRVLSPLLIFSMVQCLAPVRYHTDHTFGSCKPLMDAYQAVKYTPSIPNISSTKVR